MTQLMFHSDLVISSSPYPYVTRLSYHPLSSSGLEPYDALAYTLVNVKTLNPSSVIPWVASYRDLVQGE